MYAAFAAKPDESVIDSLIDTPTNYQAGSGNNGGNYATFNALEPSTSGTKTLTNGNLDAYLADANAARLTIPPVQPSGKFQWEIAFGSKSASYYQIGMNLIPMVYASGDLILRLERRDYKQYPFWILVWQWRFLRGGRHYYPDV